MAVDAVDRKKIGNPVYGKQTLNDACSMRTARTTPATPSLRSLPNNACEAGADFAETLIDGRE